MAHREFSIEFTFATTTSSPVDNRISKKERELGRVQNYDFGFRGGGAQQLRKGTALQDNNDAAPVAARTTKQIWGEDRWVELGRRKNSQRK